MLDARLREAAHMVASLVDASHAGLASAAAFVDPEILSGQPYERQLSCQIWSLSGTLVSRSASAPATRLSDSGDGFSERIVDDARWRVYTVRNEAAGVEVLVGDSLAVRDHIARDLLVGLSVPMLLTLPLLAAILWLAVGRGLAPLSRLAHRLEARAANDLAPLGEADTVAETLPVVRALNGLFARVGRLLGREREFLAVAAHELRTPLSGLRTQAEVAIRSPDAATREAALGRIVTGVDRSARLVRQLLEHGEAEASREAGGTAVALAPFVEAVGEEAAARLAASGGRLVLCDSLAGVRLAVPERPLMLALRNLVDNAATYAEGGTVWILWRDGALVVEDDGPGMPAAERAQATGRFFRGSNRRGPGSGLGLAIAAVCADRMDADLAIDERPGGGLNASLTFASTRIL